MILDKKLQAICESLKKNLDALMRANERREVLQHALCTPEERKVLSVQDTPEVQAFMDQKWERFMADRQLQEIRELTGVSQPQMSSILATSSSSRGKSSGALSNWCALHYASQKQAKSGSSVAKKALN